MKNDKTQKECCCCGDFSQAFDPADRRYVRLLKREVKDRWGNQQIIGMRLSDGTTKIYYPGQLTDYH